MDQLLEKIERVKFPTSRGHNGSRTNSDGIPKILHFGKSMHYGKLIVNHGSRHYPEIEKILGEIVVDKFPDFKYTNVQINKNVKCDPHRDKKNIGDSVIFTVGDFKGGRLGTEIGSLNIYRNPIMFNGSEIEHWTEDYQGDRYCVIYYTHRIKIQDK